MEEGGEMNYFDHEKLDVYKVALEVVTLMDTVVESLPRGKSHLGDQLQRAGTSIVLNIAEGSGEYSGNEKNRFYRMAKRSGTECAAVIEICQRLGFIENELYEEIRLLLVRIVSMLIKMTHKFK